MERSIDERILASAALAFCCILSMLPDKIAISMFMSKSGIKKENTKKTKNTTESNSLKSPKSPKASP